MLTPAKSNKNSICDIAFFSNSLLIIFCLWGFFRPNFDVGTHIVMSITIKLFELNTSNSHSKFALDKITKFVVYTEWVKKYQLPLKSAIFHWMSWKCGFNTIRGRVVWIWNQMYVISIEMSQNHDGLKMASAFFINRRLLQMN